MKLWDKLQRGKVLLLACCVILLVAAGGNKQVETDRGNYKVSLEFNSNPVKVGRNSMTLTVYRGGSQELVDDDLQIDVVPWMPTHEHGLSVLPEVSKTSKGVYLVEKVDLSMPGTWEIYLKITKGNTVDTAVINVSVER